MWDKNTLNTSKVDGIIEACRVLNEPFTLHILGYVKGHGVNDGYLVPKGYPIRQLHVRDRVWLERIVRAFEYDGNDTIESVVFDIGSVPAKWDIVVVL